MNAVDTVTVDLAVVLGQSAMPIGQLLRMGRGAVIELDASETEPVNIYANGQLIARGELMISGDRVAVSVTDLVGGST